MRNRYLERVFEQYFACFYVKEVKSSWPSLHRSRPSVSVIERLGKTGSTKEQDIPRMDATRPSSAAGQQQGTLRYCDLAAYNSARSFRECDGGSAECDQMNLMPLRQLKFFMCER